MTTQATSRERILDPCLQVTQTDLVACYLLQHRFAKEERCGFFPSFFSKFVCIADFDATALLGNSCAFFFDSCLLSPNLLVVQCLVYHV